MKVLIGALIILLYSSCELHEQSAYLNVKGEESIFNLEKVDTLFAAVINNDYEYLDQELLKDRSFVNIKNEQGQLLLLKAIEAKKFLLVVLLLDYGADSSLRDNDGLGPFDIIKDFKEGNSWQKLLETGVVDDSFLNKQLVHLITEGAVDIQDKILRQMKIYIDRGADLNIVEKRFPLIAHAALKNMEDVVRYLCERGDVDINVKIRNKTLLHFIKAQMRRKPELSNIYDLLVSYGAV